MNDGVGSDSNGRLEHAGIIEELRRLEKVAARLSERASTGETLQEIVRAMSAAFGTDLNSIHIIDDATGDLTAAAWIGLPEDYINKIARLKPGPKVGACGTAVFTNSLVIIDDMRDSPLWKDYLELSEPAGLRAVWSMPISTSQGQVLGSFATYYREPYHPDPKEIELARVYAQHAAIAIENACLYEQARRDRAQLKSIIDQIPEGIFIARFPDGAPILANRACMEMVRDVPQSFTLKDYEKYWTLSYPDRSIVPAEEKPMVRALHGESVCDREYYFITPNSEPRCLLISATPLRGTNGEIFGGVTVFRDITERKHLEEENRLYRTLMEQASDGIFITDPQGNLLAANPRACSMLGYEREELHRLNVRDMLMVEDMAANPLKFSELLEGHTVQSERLARRKDGTSLPVEISARMLDDGSIQGIVRDITKRKQAEEERRLSEERFSLAFNSNPTPMAITSIGSGRFIDINESFLQFTGYAKEEIIGRTSLELGIWVEPERRLEAIVMLEANQKVRNFEFRLRLKSGEERVVLLSSEIITLNGKRCILSTNTDISKRKRAEEALRASEQRFSIAFNASPVPITISSLDEGRYLYSNDAFIRTSGYRREEIIGRTAFDINFWREKEDREQAVQTLREQGSLRDLEVQFRNGHGENRVGLLSADIIELDGKECLLAVLNDITERKRAEKIQSATYRISEAANSAENLQSLFPSIHEIVGELLPAENFYIALYNKKTGVLSFPYFVDQQDDSPEPRRFGKGFTEAVISMGHPLHRPQDHLKDALERGEAELIGSPAEDWFGVPLKTADGVIGALVVQSYTEGLRFGEEETRILEYVSTQVAMAIERKRAEEALRASEERFSKSFSLSPFPMAIHRLKSGHYLDVNASFLRTFGFERDEVIGRTPSELGSWGTSEDRDKFLRCLRERKPIEQMEMTFGTKSGEIRTALLSAEVITLEDEKFVLIALNDITERKQAEELFSKAFHSSPDAMTITTLDDGIYLDVNESFLSLSGFSREEIIGQVATDISLWNNPDQRRNLIELLRSESSIRGLEMELCTRSGESLVLLLSGEVIELGGQRCALITGTDITARKRAERDRTEALVRERFARAEAETAKREWQTTFDTMTDSVSLVDAEDNLVRANRAFYSWFDLTPEEAVGRPFKSLVHAKDRAFSESENCPICALRLKGEHGVLEIPEGVITSHPIVVTVDPILDDEGKVVGVIQVIRDLSELYEARAEAERERVSLNAAIEQMDEGMIIFDKTGGVIRANHRALEIFGFSFEDITTIRPESLALSRFSDEQGHPINVDSLPVQKALREGRSIESRTWYTRPDGEKLLLLHTASPFFDEKGQVAGAISLARDVTEHQRQHERTQQADKLRALGQLASGVAHNFNNALAAVIGYTQLSIPKVTNPDVEKYLRIVEQSAKDAARMVERIHNFSHSGPGPRGFVSVRLLDIIRDAIAITRPRWRDDAAALGIRYEVRLEWKVDEELLVKGDASELREVFVNILFNALDAMKTGGVISITATAKDQEISIEVSDTGGGMTEEIKRRVFEPFFTTKGVSGLGMGLAESYRIIERHRGRIEVESHLHRGTAFIVTLPVVSLAAPASHGKAGAKSALPKRILVVDDEQFVRGALEEILKATGHEVMAASSAEEAIGFVKSNDFDLVFTDLAMPDIDGIAAAARIKELKPNVKIILMSGHGAGKAYELAGNNGPIDGAISKPFSMEEIRKTVDA